jgi:hypothetical protein
MNTAAPQSQHASFFNKFLEVFSPRKAPANFKIHSFVIRVADSGGCMLMECDDPLEVHKFCSMLPALHSKLALSSLSPTPFAWNSKRWSIAMD